MTDAADAERIAEQAVQRHRDEVARETAAAPAQTSEALIREMHGDMKVVTRVQSDQLVEAVKTNNRIGHLEAWQNRVIGAGLLALAASPLLAPPVREWIAGVLGGG